MDVLANSDAVDICVTQVEVGRAQQDGSVLQAWLNDSGTDLLAYEQEKFGRAMPCCEIISNVVAVDHRNGGLQ